MNLVDLEIAVLNSGTLDIDGQLGLFSTPGPKPDA